MEIRSLVKRLKENKIDLSLADNELEVHFDGDELSEELLGELRHNKQGIIKFLRQVQGVEEEAIPLAPVSEEGYVLSSAQRRLWVLSQFEESSVAYNNADFYVMEGELNDDAMEQAFLSVFKRHEVMRTIYRENEEGEVRQFVLPIEEVGFKMERHDFRQEPDAVNKANALLKAWHATPFDLSKGPVVRAAVYWLEDNKWLFAFVLHHIVTDAWTITLFRNELFLYYNLHCNGQADPMPPLRIQYKDYAVWQQQQLSGEQLKMHRDYWVNQFDGELPVLDLPGDKPRPLFKTYNGDTVNVILDENTSKGLRNLAQESGASLFMGLVTALKILLYEYTGQNDIIVGFPIGGRDHPDLDSQLGLYINTLALRTRFKGSDSVKELMENVRQHTLGAYEHQVYPFDELLDNLQLTKDTSRSALFDVMVVLQNITADTIASSAQASSTQPQDVSQQVLAQESMSMPTPDLKVGHHVGADNSPSKFDLTFEIREFGELLWLRIEYNTDIYHRPTIDRMGKHFAQVVQFMTANPNHAVDELQLLDAEEKEQVLHRFNDTQVPYPAEQSIVSLFEEQVARRPNSPAVAYEGNTLTYSQLNEQANQLAAYLLDKYAVQPEEKIGVMLHKSDLLIVAILGILKAGAAYVPLDIDLPPARKDYILGDTGIKVLITLPPLAATIPFFGGSIVTPMEVAEAMAGKEAVNPGVASSPNHLAYIMYTSGSTGNPKGVMIEHKGVVRLVKNTNYTHLTEESVVLSTGAISFDATTFEYWGMLLNGGKLVMGNNEVLLDEAQLGDLIKQQGVSIIFLTTGWFNQLVERALGVFEGVRTVMTGGDRASYGHLYMLRDRYPEIEIIHLYGPTENTAFSTSFSVQSVSNEWIPIGKPINNSTVYIINEQGHLVPLGMQGEICVGGDGLARGYLNQPELTAEKFVANPFVPGERMYRTGDMGRWLPDGNIVFMGRRDDQIKIRGYRIEMGEIEAALLNYPNVESVVVTARHSMDGDKELIAYLVSSEPITDVMAVAHFMATQLPAYMVPSYYVQLPELPLNNNGKVDKKKLPPPEGADMVSEAEYMEPRNETERKLVLIWQEILGREKIGIKDNFFTIGGHSLKATRMVSFIRRDFEVTLNLAALFSNPTIEHIAIEIEKIYWANNELFDIDDAENISI
jgi:amino acid adenylation domain-containing protein